MEVAVAVADPILERETITCLLREGHLILRRCLDETDIRSLSRHVVLYADAHFHSRFPHSVLVTAQQAEFVKRTRVIGIVGPHGSPGVSTIALNLACELSATVIDAAAFPSLSHLASQRGGMWYSAHIVTPPIDSLHSVISGISAAVTLIDLGTQTHDICDSLLVVVSANPLSVERYLARRRDFAEHRVVMNRVGKDDASCRALAMIKGMTGNVDLIPRDDDLCARALLAGKPIAVAGRKSPLSKALTALAGSIATAPVGSTV